MALKDVTTSGVHLATALVNPTGGGATVTLADVAQAAMNSSGVPYTDEQAQDAVGQILVDSASINFTYSDVDNLITATTIFGTTAGTVSQGNHTHTQLHDPVTLAGSTYLSITGQLITANPVNLASDVAGNLPVTRLASGNDANDLTYWRGDGTWATPPGGGGTYTDTNAQGAVGSILADSTSINFTYNNATPDITAVAIFGTSAGTVAEGNHNHDAAYVSVVATPTAGNFPVLTAGGELNNSTYSNASFATASHNHDASYASLTTSISTTNSLTGGGDLSATRTLSLVNDTAAPGNSKIYGTSAAGVKGWYDAPTGTGGSSTLDGLTDVAVTTPVNNQVLQYNSGTGQWVNAAGLGTGVLFGTDAGTVCEGNDDRIPDANEQSFLAMVTKSGDNFTITPAGVGTITFEAGSIIIRGNIVITDGTNTVTITPTTELVEV